MAIRTDGVVTLPDGRALGFAECGDPEGAPVLHFHGSPSSRLEIAAPDLDDIATRVGLRIIAIDRPGIGLSDPKPDRTVLDWPIDVVGFAEATGLSRFAAYGVSGGSPYAVACALRIPHRLKAVGVVCGTAPLADPRAREGMSRANRALFFLGRNLPWVLKRVVKRAAIGLATNADRAIERAISELSEPDRQVLANSQWRASLLASAREVFRRGVEGGYLDLKLASRAWGFELSQVPMVVNLWFGGRDQIVPPAASRYLADSLQRSEARFYPNEGHVSLLANRYEEILTGLVATADREDGRPVG